MSSSVRDAPSDGQGDEYALGCPRHHVQDDRPFLMGGRDVQERDFVGPLSAVRFRRLHRVARVHEVQEIDPLDDPPRVDIETRNDPFG